MLKAVVFDLDGTLVDSAPDIASGINRMLAGYGLPPQDVRWIEQLTGEGANALVAKVYDSIGEPVDEARIARDTATYLDHYRQRPAADSRLYADATTALPALHWMGIRLAVCTNKQQALARAVLAHFGLAGWIETVVGADTTPHRKPHPAPLLHALNHLSVTPDEALFVGDTAIDRDCAAAAGVGFRVVGWGTGAGVPVSPAQRLQCFADLLPGPI